MIPANAQETCDQLIQYLQTQPHSTYLAWVEQHQAALERLTEDQRHPYDVIGLITLKAVATLRIDAIQQQINVYQAAEASDPGVKPALRQLEKDYAKQAALYTLQESLSAFIVANNVAKVMTENLLYYRSTRVSADTDYVPVQDKTFFTSHPSYFALTAEQKKLGITQADIQDLFWMILEHTRRHKERTTMTFKRPSVLTPVEN